MIYFLPGMMSFLHLSKAQRCYISAFSQFFSKVGHQFFLIFGMVLECVNRVNSKLCHEFLLGFILNGSSYSALRFCADIICLAKPLVTFGQKSPNQFNQRHLQN